MDQDTTPTADRSEDSILRNLRQLGFEVVPNGTHDGDKTYTVKKDGQIGLLDLTSFEDMHDTLRSIEAQFNLRMDVEDEPDQPYPVMNTRNTGTNLATRVAAIGESLHQKLPVRGASMLGGRTRHHDVYIIAPDAHTRALQKAMGHRVQTIIALDGVPAQWLESDFMRGKGPVRLDPQGQWVLVNADELRDVLRPYLRTIPPGDEYELPPFPGWDADQTSFGEAKSNGGLVVLAIADDDTPKWNWVFNPLEHTGALVGGRFYKYSSGSAGGDSFSNYVLFWKPGKPLEPFDDWDGSAKNYPILAELNHAFNQQLDDAAWDLNQYGAGSLAEVPAAEAMEPILARMRKADPAKYTNYCLDRGIDVDWFGSSEVPDDDADDDLPMG